MWVLHSVKFLHDCFILMLLVMTSSDIYCRHYVHIFIDRMIDLHLHDYGTCLIGIDTHSYYVLFIYIYIIYIFYLTL